MLYAYLVAVCIVAYLIGSIPTGYIIVKLLKGEDIRKIGSGSTGATNVKRVLGKNWFFITIVLDAIKGALPVFVAVILSSEVLRIMEQVQCIQPPCPPLPIGSPLDTHMFAPVLAAIFVLIGHSKPLFLGFRGGKSVASGVGTLIALCWQAGLAVAVVWAVITYLTRYVSVGSIIALALSPIFMFFMHKPLIYVVYCTIGAVYIIYLHRENIVRLRRGEENKVR